MTDTTNNVDSSQEPVVGNGVDNTDAGAQEYLEKLQAMEAEVRTTRESSEKLSKDFQSSQDVLNKIKGAFGGDTKEERDEAAEFADEFLEASLADKSKGGSGMPLTTKLAVSLAESMKANKAMRLELDEIKKAIQQQNNPEEMYNRQAFTWFDTEIQNNLEMIYGKDYDRSLFGAVANNINQEISQLRQTKPAVWAEIRRNPAHVRSMAMKFVERVVPPKARQMLAAEKAKNTPMTRQDLMNAKTEADAIEDPRARSQAKAQIRQQILSQMYSHKDV